MDSCPDTIPRPVSPAEIEADAWRAKQARAWGSTSGRVDTLPGDGAAQVCDAVALRLYLGSRLSVLPQPLRRLAAGAIEAGLAGVEIEAQDRDALIAAIRALPVAR